ncbi:MAG: PKD domain-containing protein [Phycisphaerae bacterium]|nr:PKD domain-containing protein [Phycisphaerae bacterium]
MFHKNINTIAGIFCLLLLFFSSVAVAQSSAEKVSSNIWDEFKFPEVVVLDRDKGETKGSALVGELIPDLETFIQEISVGVCKKLYKHPDEVPVFKKLTFEMKHYDGIAAKSGNAPSIRISMSTKYLEGQYKRMGDEAITYEIAGINWHELTHGYQHSPRNAGGYRSGTDYFGCIEGVADAVRILAGYHKTRKPRPGGHWNSGYTTTGFFIVWLNENRDPDFLYKFNQSCKTINPWSWNKACKEIFGPSVTVAQLWNEYQWDLKGGGKEAVADFKPETDLVCLGQPVKFSNTSFNQPVSYEWSFEGANIKTSSQPGPSVSYAKPGDYDVTLVAKNEHGKTTKTIKSCIHVLDKKGTVTSLISPDGKISHKSQTSAMPGEGIKNLLDKNPKSKLCIKSKNTQIQYVLPESCRLCSYSFTSANDAPGRDPENWTLEGSENGTDWTEIDQQKNQSFKDRYQVNRYVVNCKSNFKFYRWNLEAKTDPIFQLAEIDMLGIKEN